MSPEPSTTLADFIRGVLGGFGCNGDIDMAASERELRARRAGSRAASAWAALGGFFFPARLGEAAALQVGVGDHRHEHVAVQAMPGSAFEMIEAEFFLELRIASAPPPLAVLAALPDGD